MFAEFSSNLADLCKRSFSATDLEERLEYFESSHGYLPKLLPARTPSQVSNLTLYASPVFPALRPDVRLSRV
jgi:hypothetical protein